MFVEHPPLDLRAVTVVLNLDMVGRLRRNAVTIFGVEDASLRALVESANAEPRFTLSLRPHSSQRSDDYPFAMHGVHALHVTTGEHIDYHRAGDTPARLDFVGLARVTDFAERIVRAAADGWVD